MEKTLLFGTLDEHLVHLMGTKIINDTKLMSQPTAICVYRHGEGGRPGDNGQSVAVGSGPHVFIYRQFRAFSKFTLPALDLAEEEVALYRQMEEESIDAETAFEALSRLRDGGTPLSSRSQDLLALPDAQLRASFVESLRRVPLVQRTVVTCMLAVSLPNSAPLLLVGTEAGTVLLLQTDSAVPSLGGTVPLPNAEVPFQMSATVSADGGFRVAVATRGGSVFCLRDGESRGSVVLVRRRVRVQDEICAVAMVDGVIAVVTASARFLGFLHKPPFSPLFALALPAYATCLASASLERGWSGWAVGLQTGEVRFYESHGAESPPSLSSTVRLAKPPVTGLFFGTYGREDGSLVALDGTGGIHVKILRRTAAFGSTPASEDPASQEPIPIPKRTKLYLEQIDRERSRAQQMHQRFQHDLCRLKLETARVYVASLQTTGGQLEEEVRVHCEVDGLGPVFNLIVSLTFVSDPAPPLRDLDLVLGLDPAVFSSPSPALRLPLLLPGKEVRRCFQLRNRTPLGCAGEVELLLLSRSQKRLLLSSLVTIPRGDIDEEQNS